MKRLLYLVIAIALLIGIFFLFSTKRDSPLPSDQSKDPGNYSTISISVGENHILAEVANTSEERTLGLGNRSSMPTDHGMIFLFDRPDSYGFWMKDTFFPLDIIWINADKKIITIKNEVATSTYPQVFYPTSPALYVLELNAGYAQEHDIKIGDRVNF